jgi:hypothetical protein
MYCFQKAYCKICASSDLTSIIEFWAPEEGWVFARLCCGCKENALKRKPQMIDYTWNKRHERCKMFAQEVITPFIFHLPKKNKGKMAFLFSSLLRGIIGLP